MTTKTLKIGIPIPVVLANPTAAMVRVNPMVLQTAWHGPKGEGQGGKHGGSKGGCNSLICWKFGDAHKNSQCNTPFVPGVCHQWKDLSLKAHVILRCELMDPAVHKRLFGLEHNGSKMSWHVGTVM